MDREVREAGANHFFHHGTVHDQSYFFGRSRESAQLFDLLKHQQSISISGQRRLGKSSLIFHVSTPEVAAQNGLDPAQTRWIYLDGGVLDGLDEDTIYGAVAREMGGGEAESVPYTQLAGIVRTLVSQQLRLILVFDEFEIFAQNARLQPHMFNRLRGLAGQFPVQYLIVSKEPLARLSFANPDVISSSFFHIFKPLRLSLFSTDEARDMLLKLSRRGGAAFNDETIDFILELVGPHPQFLTIAGSHAFLVQRRGALSADARTEVRERTLEELEGHLEYYWRDLGTEEQYSLAALPLHGTSARSEAMSRLHDDALVRGAGFLGVAVAEYVARQRVEGLLRYGPFLMDEKKRGLAVNGKPTHLTPTEFAALRLLLQHPDRIVTPEEIEAALWPDEIAPDPERARGVVKKVKEKLRSHLGEAIEGIYTHWGQGFSLTPPAAPGNNESRPASGRRP